MILLLLIYITYYSVVECFIPHILQYKYLSKLLKYDNYNHEYGNIHMTSNYDTDIWSNKLLPSSYRVIESTMLESLQSSLIKHNDNNNNDDNTNINNDRLSQYKCISIDVLTPGLNSKLEQKAMLFQEYLFDLLISMMNTLLLSFNNIHFAFQSIGDFTIFTL